MASKSPAAPKDHIYHPEGFAWAALGPIFVAFVPVTQWLTVPGGLFESILTRVVSGVAYVASAGSASAVSTKGTLPAISALYIAATYAFTGSASVGAAAAGSERGRSNNNPRLADAGLRGFPLRLKSAHLNLVENFGGFALAAALTAAYAPTDRHALNLLGLHVLSKLFLYYPSYLMNVAPTRSLAHLLATSSVIGVAWRLAMAV